MSLFNWFAYGLGASVGGALLAGRGRARRGGPVRRGTEADFKRDEARFAEEERRLDEADREAARKRRGDRDG